MADLVANLAYDDDETPIIKITKKTHPTGTIKLIQPREKYFAIRLDTKFWRFVEDKNEDFDEWMFGCTRDLCIIFDLGKPNSRKMSQIAHIIEQKIDDLVNMPPPQQEIKVVGEAEFLIKALHGNEANIRGVVPIRDMNPVKKD